MLGTPIWEIQVAAASAIEGNATLMGKIDALRDTEVAQGEDRPDRYLVLSDFPGDAPANTFGRKGRDNLMWIHLWHNGRSGSSVELGNRLPSEIIGLLMSIFDETQIALDDWTMLNGTLQLVRLSRDPVIPYMHGVLQYRVLSKAPVVP